MSIDEEYGKKVNYLTMKYKNIREEELKNSVATEYFEPFDCDCIVGCIDFAVKIRRTEPSIDFADEYLLWAEAKRNSHDIYAMFTQLILTIGKARTFDKILPPPFLGAFDAEKIAFIPYSAIQNIFYQNDFNWKVTSSNTETKEFKQVYAQVENIIGEQTTLFDYEKDEQELRSFIKDNFVVGKSGATKIKINKNNFIFIYNKWLATVKPTIVANWAAAKKNGIIDGDFYLADLLSQDNKTLKEKLFVLLRIDHYEMDKRLDDMGMLGFKTTSFMDNQKAHQLFWNKYERPPREEYWDYIVKRRDLLVPQDVRERKGSFFTPRIWVELSQKYIADVLGEDWQDEYYVWDCAAGTGNLLAGLVNKDNIWASTLDKQDVDVMHDRISNGANLWPNQVFHFDFLNDEFAPISKGGKMPDELYGIVSDPCKRRKLVIYINPPYAEDTNKINLTNTSFKGRVAQNLIHNKYSTLLKKANHELFVQFLIRVYCEIDGAMLAHFSKLKCLQAPNFEDFRNNFEAKLEKLFVLPASTFDNVNGQFPIGFFVWNTGEKEKFEHINADVFGRNGNFTGNKSFWAYNDFQYINDWIKQFRIKSDNKVGILNFRGNDFQHQSMVFIENSGETSMTQLDINADNLVVASIYFAVRHCIEAMWLNDRDQFLYPNDKWKNDAEFQNDCLAYTLFSNNIQSQYGINHWIPFTEKEVGAVNKFESRFMTDFMAGKVPAADTNLYKEKPSERRALIFSTEAQAVFADGRALWRYYQQQPNANVNASLYDIREHFQGRNDKGKMNNKSADKTYNELLGNLRQCLKTLASKIEPKVYEYDFLKK
jgi:hypothetical protein